MNIKTNYWLEFVVVLIFLAIVALDSAAMKLSTAEKIQVIERSDQELRWGKVLDKPSRLFGEYIVFWVEYLNDKQEKSRISVIIKPNFKWSQTESRDFNVGDEILFFLPVVTAQTDKGKAFFCPIGIFYSGKYKGESFINGYEVANPPKKK
jgi:hypothetical protein